MEFEVKFIDMCRACMSVDGVLISMYDDETISKKNLPLKLAELTSIEIDKNDGLPTKLCTKCAYRTDVLYEFKLQVQATEMKLRQMVESCYKEEVKDEDPSLKENLENNTSETNQSLQEGNIVLGDDLNHVIHVDSNGEPIDIDISNIAEGHILENQDDIYIKNIIMSKLEKIDIDAYNEADTTKLEIPEHITEIFQEENMDYAIMYIPESVNDTIEQIGVEHTECSNSIIIPITTRDIQNHENLLNNNQILENGHLLFSHDLNTDNVTSETAVVRLEPQIESGMKVDDQSPNKSNENEQNEDSDSDYFAEPRDNILGSLNDTITRIKEIKLEGNIKQYQCTLCLQNYDELTGVLLHTIDNHVPTTGPFYCVVCEKDCDSRKSLRTHAKTHTGQYPYSCFICQKAYASKRYLKRHMVCHTDFPKYRCAKCGQRFKVKSELESHITIHVNGAPYCCSQCPRVFNHKGNYKRHLITHLDPQGLRLPKYPCNVCGKRFLNNRTLETHNRVHTGEKPYKCDICKKSFSQQGNLINHVRIHSNPRSYTCEVCGKRFNQASTLRDHRLIHTGEKPYICNVCGIAFTFSAALRRHMWIHSKGKPLQCEICNSKFVGKYDLRRHMAIHTDRPKYRRKKKSENPNEKANKATKKERKRENETLQIPNIEPIIIEEVLLNQDNTQIVHQEESEKENVDALFNLIQYG